MNIQYVIKTKSNKHIGIDTASGGYPFESNTVTGARIWNNKDEAKRYRDTFISPAYGGENWSLHEVKIDTKTTSWV